MFHYILTIPSAVSKRILCQVKNSEEAFPGYFKESISMYFRTLQSHFFTLKSSCKVRGSQHMMTKKANPIRTLKWTSGSPTSNPVNVRSSLPTSETKQEFRTRIPQEYDVLFGRGGGINNHPGNIHFRKIVRSRKQDYTSAKSKEDKAKITNEIMVEINTLLPNGGRFLVREVMGSQNELTGWWVQADQEKIFAKISQALRERMQAPSKSYPSELIRSDSLVINSNERGKRKETSQDAHSSKKKLHAILHCETFPRKEIVNFPIITSMKGGHRGKQLIYPQGSVKLLGRNEKVNEHVDGNERKIADNLEIPKRVPQTAPSNSEVSGANFLRKEFDEAMNPPGILNELTRCNSLTFKVGERKHFFNDGTESSSKAITKYRRTSSKNLTSNESSDVSINFKDIIYEENKEHRGTKKFGKTPTTSMPITGGLRSENVMTTQIILSSQSRIHNKMGLPQVTKPRRTYLRENSMAFSDDEEGDLDLNEKFENPFENEH